MEAAHQLVDDLAHWIGDLYLQLSRVNPLHNSPPKIIDALMLMRHAHSNAYLQAVRPAPTGSPFYLWFKNKD